MPACSRTTPGLPSELIADAVIRPAFAEKEVSLLRKQTLSALQLDQSQPASIASRAFRRGLFGSHPYGRESDPLSVDAITRQDLIEPASGRACGRRAR